MTTPPRLDDPSAWLGRELAEIIIQRMLASLMPMTGYDPGRPVSGRTWHATFHPPGEEIRP